MSLLQYDMRFLSTRLAWDKNLVGGPSMWTVDHHFGKYSVKSQKSTHKVLQISKCKRNIHTREITWVALSVFDLENHYMNEVIDFSLIV